MVANKARFTNIWREVKPRKVFDLLFVRFDCAKINDEAGKRQQAGRRRQSGLQRTVSVMGRKRRQASTRKRSRWRDTRNRAKCVAAAAAASAVCGDLLQTAIGSNAMSPGIMAVFAYGPFSHSNPRKHNTNENHLSLCAPSLCFLFISTWARATRRAITVRKQTYKTERGLGGWGTQKSISPGLLNHAYQEHFPPAPPPSTPTPDRHPQNTTPSHYKTFNLNVKLKRNGFCTRLREWDLDFKFHFNRAANVPDCPGAGRPPPLPLRARAVLLGSGASTRQVSIDDGHRPQKTHPSGKEGPLQICLIAPSLPPILHPV